MREVTPNVYLIGRSEINFHAARQWLDSIGANTFTFTEYADGLSSGQELVRLAGKRCYMSFEPGLNPNVQRVRTDMADFIENILKVGHGSVIEHASYTFAIENVSRVFTGEMNRHRAGMAISEGSMRFIRFTDMPFWRPTSLQVQDDDPESMKEKKRMTWEVFKDVIAKVESSYRLLEELWAEELAPTSTFAQKKHLTSMFRRIVPMGVATGGIWTGNLRALRHIFTMRCAPSAEEEILLVASMMLEMMMKAEPLFFRDFEKVNGYWQPKYMKV